MQARLPMTPKNTRATDSVPYPKQRRYVAVLFADLCDSTLMSGELDAEEVADALDRYRAVCRTAVERHQGIVVRLQGDGVLAVFGYPKPAEDAVRRALEAAEDLRVAVPAIPMNWRRPLQVHSGVHAGLVLIQRGDVERGRIDLVGDLPNIVARLSAAAGPAEVLVADGAAGPDGGHFVFGPLRQVPVHRDHGVVPARPMLRRAPAMRPFQARARRGLARFVGRDAELDRLADYVTTALAPNTRRGGAAGVCATISGGPGMGKSRLVDELRARLAGRTLQVVSGHCEGYLGTEPLQPLRQVAHGLVARSDTLRALLPDDSRTPLLAAALGLSGQPVGTMAELGSALGALIAAAAAQQPLLLLLDDWQWADDASHQCLRELLERPLPLAVVLTSRDLEVQRWAAPGAPHIELRPLSLTDAASTVASLLPRADPLLVRDLYEVAGGVPLFLEELCHASSTGRQVQPPRRVGEAESWIGMLVEARLEPLDQPTRAFLEMCAAIGTVQPLWLLAQLLGDEVALQPLAAAGVEADVLLVDGPALRFKHVLLRDAVYALVAPTRRRELHASIHQALQPADAAAMDDGTPHDALAQQAEGAGWPRLAAGHAERAGDCAMAAVSFDLARRHYATVVRLLEAEIDPDSEQRAHWARAASKLGMACVFDPLTLADGVGLFERALANAQALADAAVLARSRYWLAYILYAKGRAAAALHHVQAALDGAEQVGDRRLAAQVRATLGQILASACRYAEALPLLDEALQGKRQQARAGSGVAIGSAYALAVKGGVLGDLGRFTEADACFDEALELLGGSVHPVGASLRGWMGVVRLWQGRAAQALAVAETGEHIAERARVRQLLALNRAVAGYARWRLGGGEAAYLQVREATTWTLDNKGEFYTSLNHGWLVEMAVALGRDDEVRDHATRLLRRARAQDLLGMAQGCRALARQAARHGRKAAAQRYLALADRAARQRRSGLEQQANIECADALGLVPAPDIRPRSMVA
jgi:tetratricopeptide (TPR) repeat protein